MNCKINNKSNLVRAGLQKLCAFAALTMIMTSGVNAIPTTANSTAKPVLEDMSTKTQHLIQLGESYAAARQYQKAISAYSQAIALNTNLGQAYSDRGIAYAGLKQNQKAISDFSKAIELNPKDGPSYAYRGDAYTELKQYQRAITDYSQAIRLSPTFYLVAAVQLCRGEDYYRLGQYQNAINDCSKALSVRLGNKLTAEAYTCRGQAYEKLGKHDFAKSDFAWANKFGHKPEQK